MRAKQPRVRPSRAWRGALFKRGGPWRVSITPIAASDRSAARTLGRLMPICRASSRSGGSRWPGTKTPFSMRRRTYSTA
jgi:hypothetical protein